MLHCILTGYKFYFVRVERCPGLMPLNYFHNHKNVFISVILLYVNQLQSAQLGLALSLLTAHNGNYTCLFSCKSFTQKVSQLFFRIMEYYSLLLRKVLLNALKISTLPLQKEATSGTQKLFALSSVMIGEIS